jgi:hypothetical protein
MSLKLVLRIKDYDSLEWIKSMNIQNKAQNKVQIVDGILGLQIAIYNNGPNSRYPLGLLALWVVDNRYYHESYGYEAYKVLDLEDTDSDIFCLMQFLKNSTEFDELVEKMNLGELLPRNNRMTRLSPMSHLTTIN